MNSCAAKSFSYAKFSRPKTRTYYCISVSFDVSSACSLEKSLIKFFSVLNFLCRAGSAPASPQYRKGRDNSNDYSSLSSLLRKKFFIFYAKSWTTRKLAKVDLKSLSAKGNIKGHVCTKDMYDVVGSSALPCKKTFDLLLCLSFFLMHVNLFFQMM